MKTRWLVTFVCILPGLLTLTTAVAAYENLKVLPRDIDAGDLEATMVRMSRALGVPCTHCHVSEDAPEKDDMAAKSTARAMIQMTIALNRDHFGYEGAPLVTCVTCHQGRRVPVTRPDDGSDLLPEGPPVPTPNEPGEGDLSPPPPAVPEAPPAESPAPPAEPETLPTPRDGPADAPEEARVPLPAAPTPESP
jgi:hypothetical protein